MYRQTWTAVGITLAILAQVSCQGERQYDENEWVPINPTHDKPKATERVLQSTKSSFNNFAEQQDQKHLQEIYQQYLRESGQNLGVVPLNNSNENKFYQQQQQQRDYFPEQERYILPTSPTNKNKQSQDEQVQLLYVPYEMLQKGQLPSEYKNKPVYVKKPEQADRLENIKKDFLQQAIESQRLQQQFQLGQLPQVYTTTTPQPKPRRRKPHQPPLAVFLESTNKAEVNDVLNELKNAETISVRDNVGPGSPKIFVGPSSLEPPDGYSKFDLPYLSTVENNRIQRRINSLPFFVAPLSYKTPIGYSKIPLPAPHVGSVVVANHEQEVTTIKSKPTTVFLKPSPYLGEIEPTRSDLLPKTPARIPYNFNHFSDAQASNEEPITASHQQTKPQFPQLSTQLFSSGGESQFHLPLHQTKQLSGENDLAQYQLPQQLQLDEQQYRLPQQLTGEVPQRQKPYVDLPQLSPGYSVQFTSDGFQNYQFATSTQQPRRRPPQKDNRYQGEQKRKPQVAFLETTQQFPSHLKVEKSKEREQFTTSTTTTTESSRDSYYGQQGILLSTAPGNQQFFSGQYSPREPSIQQQVETTSQTYFPPTSYEYQEVPTSQRVKQRKTKTTRAPKTTTSEADDSRYTILEEFAVKTEIPAKTYEEPTNPPQTTKSPLLPTIQSEPEATYEQKKIPVQHLNPEENYKNKYLPEVTTDYKPQELSYQDQASLYDVPGQLPPLNPSLPGLINNLQDQSVRQLIVPGLLIPGNDHKEYTSSTVYTTTTTEAPTTITTTTTQRPTQVSTSATNKRSRSRYRFTTTAATPSDEVRSTAPRRNPQRGRRPVSRTRPEPTRAESTRAESTRAEEQPTVSYTPERVTHVRQQPTEESRKELLTHSPRQRIRTRGRVATTTSTTPAVTEEAAVQPHSYMQFERSTENVVAVTSDGDESQKLRRVSVETENPRVYTSPGQYDYENPQLLREHQQSVVNVEITHPMTESTRATSTTTERPTVKRGRGRGRMRHTTTTTEVPTTRRSTTKITTRTTPISITTKSPEKQAAEDEFYGFIRQPNFNSKPVINYQAPTTTTIGPLPVQPLGYMANTYSEDGFVYYSPNNNDYVPPIIQYTANRNSLGLQNQYDQLPTAVESREETPQYTRKQSTPQYRQETQEYIPRETYPARETTQYARQDYDYQYSQETTPISIETTTLKPKPQPRVTIPQATYSHLTNEPQFNSVQPATTPVTERAQYSTGYSQVTTTPSPDVRQRNPVRGRSRGRVHFQLPESVRREKEKDADEADVEGGNYPANFPKREASTPAPSFQITVEPEEVEEIVASEQEHNGDQEVHSSVQMVSVVRPDGFVEETDVKPVENGLGEAIEEVMTTTEEALITESPEALEARETPEEHEAPAALKAPEAPQALETPEAPVTPEDVTTEEPKPTESTSSAPQPRFVKKRGKWRLVRQRQLTDPLETAESQNIQSAVANNYFTYKPEKTLTTTERSIFEDIYEMFGISEEQQPSSTTQLIPETTTTASEAPTTLFPETTPLSEQIENTTTEKVVFITENYPEDMKKLAPYEVEPWQMKVIRTSTSTEVSHATEICFKGKCVRSVDDSKKR